MLVGGVLLILGGLVVGLVFGNTGTADGKLEMGNFLATRPMTSADMARTILKAAVLSTLLAWAFWAMAFLAVYAIILIANVDPTPHLPTEVGWWYFPATLLGTWTALAAITTIGLTGRPTLYGLLFCGLPALTLGAILFSHYVLSPDGQTQFKDGITAIVGAIYIVGTFWAFSAARRRALIDMPTTWAALGVFGILCLAGTFFWSQHRDEPPATPWALFVHVIGLFALVVFPLAAAPLAVTWNRNR